MIFKLIREITFVHIREHLPHLPYHLVNPYSPDDVDDDARLILWSGKAKDPVAAKRLLEAAQARTALELDLKRPRPRANKRRRLLNWLRRLEGSTPTEQVISKYLRGQQEAARPYGIVHQVPLEDWK